MSKTDYKTNVMRILEHSDIAYTAHEYSHESGAISGVAVAGLLGVPPYMIYKTLVTKGASKSNYIFVIPVDAELDLKKAAKTVGEKSIVMIKQAELLPLTGYVHGGCSPVGMKKQFTTVYEEEIILLETVIVSAGKIGYQIELAPNDLIFLTNGLTADVVSS
ncbi:MAG: Cys-tRNA(Pro) deacylase [Oscillospiraceae bacterium]